MPRAEEGGIEFDTLGRCQRRQQEIDKVLGQLFLAGISTRRLRQMTEELHARPRLRTQRGRLPRAACLARLAGALLTTT